VPEGSDHLDDVLRLGVRSVRVVALEAVNLDVYPARRDPGVGRRVPIEPLELGHYALADDDSGGTAILDEPTLDDELTRAG
jgi:hypothetical protein